MTNRERVRAIMHYEPVDRVPVVAFGFWNETLEKWRAEGHVTQEQCDHYGDNTPAEQQILDKLGFDFNWYSCVKGITELLPAFEETVLETEPDGSQIIRDANGLIVRKKPGIVSIPAEIGTTLTDRKAWEEHYLPRLRYCEERIPTEKLKKAAAENATRTNPLGLYCGSMYGFVRELMGVEQISYMQVDDEELYVEIIDTAADLVYRMMERMLQFGVEFDFAHYWEDICFKNGPLVHPAVFAEVTGHHYRRMNDLFSRNGIDLVSLDCDGCIDKLIPVWLDNGVNIMFPIEVGTWNASIAPWREKFGRVLRGVGGMNKNVFSCDRAAVDREIERLRPLVDMGGYIPCPDHRIAPDAKYENVAYYCERFRSVFG